MSHAGSSLVNQKECKLETFKKVCTQKLFTLTVCKMKPHKYKIDMSEPAKMKKIKNVPGPYTQWHEQSSGTVLDFGLG